MIIGSQRYFLTPLHNRYAEVQHGGSRCQALVYRVVTCRRFRGQVGSEVRSLTEQCRSSQSLVIDSGFRISRPTGGLLRFEFVELHAERERE